jgi:membrane fusion protein (multidrug efflux system)
VVEVVTVQPQTLVDVVALVGQLESEESVEIRSEIDGVIESVGFKEGQEVRKGTVLFHLRDVEQRARLHEAEANAALAEDVFRRTTQLARQNIAAAAQLDRARADLAGGRARVELARVEIERTSVRAPFDGVLGVRHVSPGDRVTTATSLVQLDAVARLRLAFVVPEIAVPIARVGGKVKFRTAPYPGEEFTGEVFFVAPTLDAATRRLLLKAWVPNSDLRLRPGLFADLELALGERADALLVPEEAVVYDRQGSYVWRVGADGLAERVAVEVGAHRAGRVELKRGIRAGDVIVSAGTHKVTQGAPVRPAAPRLAEPPAGAASPAPLGGGR